MKTLQRFFFNSEEVHPSDNIWFYGGMAVWFAIAAFTVLAVFL